MKLDLKNKKVLITGGSKGIGFEIIKILLGKGCLVHNISRSKPSISHPNLTSHMIDLYENLPKLDEFYDLVILNIGLNPGQKSFDDYSIDEMNRTVFLNLNIHLLILKTIKYTKAAFICSILSMTGLPNNSLYCSCKSFISTFNESLRREGKDTYILYPYKVNTTLFTEVKDLFTLDKEEVAKTLVKDIEIGKKERVIPFIFRLFPLIKLILPRCLMDWLIVFLLKLFIKTKKA